MGNLLIEQRELAGLKEEHPKSSSRVTTFLSLHQMLLSVDNAYHKFFYGEVLGERGQNEVLLETEVLENLLERRFVQCQIRDGLLLEKGKQPKGFSMFSLNG